MSRQFDTTAGADSITFAVGNSPPDQGPITVAVLAKSASTAGYTGWMLSGQKAGTRVWGFLTSNNSGAKLFAENDFGDGVSGLSTSWRWYVMTKASGSAPPRFHVWDLSGAWSHTDNDANVGDGTGPIDTLILGSNGTNGWRGSIAVAATWASQLDDAGVEAAMTLSAADTLAVDPGWMVRLNQAATTDAVTDDTAGGGDQTDISGTTVDADDPPGYDYALTSTQTVLPASIDVGATLGAPALSQAHTVAPTSIAVPASLGAPAVGQSLAVAPASLTVPVALGVPAVAMAVNLPGLTVPISLGAPVLDGAVYVPPAGGNWESLRGVLYAARADAVQDAERRRHPLDCPEHGWPLQRVRDGVYHCQFGGHTVTGG